MDALDLPTARVLRRPHHAWEPLRTKLGFIERRIINMLDGARRGGLRLARPGCAPTSSWSRGSLGSEHVAHGALRRLLRQVDIFGFHLAGLDLRQNANVVDAAVARAAAGLRGRRRGGAPGAAGRRDRRRRAAGWGAARTGTAGELVAALDAAALASAAYGPEVVRCLIVSMTEQPSHVLGARWLAQRAGAALDLRFVPLFETLDDLERAPADDGQVVRLAAYRQLVRDQGDRQIIMLGYSDSGKDGSFIASQWALRGAQIELARQAAERGRRAGAVPRPRRVDVARRRADVPRDRRAADRLAARADPDHRAGRDDQRALRAPGAGGALAGADAVARSCWRPTWRGRRRPRTGAPTSTASRARSREVYRALVYDDPDFARFFFQITPIDALADLNIGSRPPSRGRRRDDRVAARDPVGLRVDAEPDPAAVLVRRGHRAGRGRLGRATAR